MYTSIHPNFSSWYTNTHQLNFSSKVSKHGRHIESIWFGGRYHLSSKFALWVPQVPIALVDTYIPDRYARMHHLCLL